MLRHCSSRSSKTLPRNLHPLYGTVILQKHPSLKFSLDSNRSGTHFWHILCYWHILNVLVAQFEYPGS